MAMQFELTDTFGGEANYAWVKRAYTAREELTDRQLVRLAKRWAGLTGRRCAVDNYGDTIAIRPINACVVLFVDHTDRPVGNSID